MRIGEETLKPVLEHHVDFTLRQGQNLKPVQAAGQGLRCPRQRFMACRTGQHESTWGCPSVEFSLYRVKDQWRLLVLIDTDELVTCDLSSGVSEHRCQRRRVI